MSSSRAAERFLSRIVKLPDGCWMWQGTKNPNGYGSFYVGNEYPGRNQDLAHRAAYRMFKGPIPKGLSIDHLCRRPLCVNPDHLEAVSLRENILRGAGVAAVNAAKTHCIHGHPLSGANLRIVQGKRQCVTCLRSAGKAHQQRRRDWGRAVRPSTKTCPKCGEEFPADVNIGGHLAGHSHSERAAARRAGS